MCSFMWALIPGERGKKNKTLSPFTNINMESRPPRSCSKQCEEHSSMRDLSKTALSPFHPQVIIFHCIPGFFVPRQLTQLKSQLSWDWFGKNSVCRNEPQLSQSRIFHWGPSRWLCISLQARERATRGKRSSSKACYCHALLQNSSCYHRWSALWAVLQQLRKNEWTDTEF